MAFFNIRILSYKIHLRTYNFIFEHIIEFIELFLSSPYLMMNTENYLCAYENKTKSIFNFFETVRRLYGKHR